jgi:1-acyl-sn-glycerol-3-phosphate acyltransferase
VVAFGAITACCWLCFAGEALLRGQSARLAVINKWVPRWAGINLWLFGIRVDACGPHVNEGKLYPGEGPHQVGRIFVANHRSSLDIPVLLTLAATHVISRHDLARWPLIGRCARSIGTLFVDRTSRRSGAAVLREVDQALGRGEGVAMFPEGTAYRGDEVHPFRPGAFNAACRARAEVIPIGLAYDQEAAYFHAEPFLSHVRRVASLPRLRVVVEVGRPLTMQDDSSIALKEAAQAEVQRLVTRCRARLDGVLNCTSPPYK